MPVRLHLCSGRRIQMSKTVFVVPPHNCRLKNRGQNLSKCIVRKPKLVGSANSVFKIFETAVGACMQRPGLAAVLEFMFVQPGNQSRLIIWWWIYNKKLISKRSGPDWSWQMHNCWLLFRPPAIAANAVLYAVLEFFFISFAVPTCLAIENYTSTWIVFSFTLFFIFFNFRSK